ncbi:uncharacterized protein TNCV_1826271 [Trichonephila clavipes]|nr:uncharacterized protein TNCV_1826271 [Trichonephila clavipes]
MVTVDEWYRYRIVAGFVTSSSPVPLKTHRVGQRCTLNLLRAETSSYWCGVVVKRGIDSSGGNNREETIPMLMLNHSDSREDSLPKQGGLTNGSRSDSTSRIELGLGSSSPTASQVQPKDQAGSANCTRHPTTSNGRRLLDFNLHIVDKTMPLVELRSNAPFQIEGHEIHRGKELEVRLSLALSTKQMTVRISSAKFPEGTIDGDTTYLYLHNLGKELKGKEIFSTPLHL